MLSPTTVPCTAKLACAKREPLWIALVDVVEDGEMGDSEADLRQQDFLVDGFFPNNGFTPRDLQAVPRIRSSAPCRQHSSQGSLAPI